MRLSGFVIAAVVVAQSIGTMTSAHAQNDALPCDAFYRNADGSWTATQSLFIPGTGRVTRPGGRFQPGHLEGGVDVAATLEKACPHPQAAPIAPAVPEAQPNRPRISLTSFADANGIIDISRLTCGQLADTNEEEASLLVAWYGAPAIGPKGRRSFALARLRSDFNRIIAYCRDNRDANLVKFLDSIVK